MAKKILIIEDDKILAETLQAMLDDTGKYETAVAHDGATGLELAESFSPDLIILDLLMPGTTGLDLLDKWQKTGLVNRIPVTVATNLEHLQVMNRALKMGVRNYFLKSEMTPEAIIKHCEKVLSEPAGPTEPSESETPASS